MSFTVTDAVSTSVRHDVADRLDQIRTLFVVDLVDEQHSAGFLPPTLSVNYHAADIRYILHGSSSVQDLRHRRTTMDHHDDHSGLTRFPPRVPPSVTYHAADPYSSTSTSMTRLVSNETLHPKFFCFFLVAMN